MKTKRSPSLARQGRRLAARLAGMLLLALVAGCSTTVPQTESTDFRARSETLRQGGVRVSASVLSPEESRQTFGVPLADRDIQPIWVEIQNRDSREYTLMLLGFDPDYYAPSEVAWRLRGTPDESGRRRPLETRINAFLGRQVPVIIPSGATVSGFVYTNLDPGRKAFSVELAGDNVSRDFEFVQLVPGFDADFLRVDFDTLYPANQVRNLTLPQLRRYLEQLPCCVAGGDRKTDGDPLNLVLIGEDDLVLSALARQGWDFTETIRFSTVARTVASSLFKSAYRTSPVSALYLFDRPQDAAFQKTRSNVDERNHLRLWRAPVTLNGRPVWVGQISRDIGVKLSSVTLVTHKIDPHVDEARFYITQDIADSGSLEALGYVSGVGPSDEPNPRVNYTRDPYYTDGNRVVMILSRTPRPPSKVRLLNWEVPEF